MGNKLHQLVLNGTDKEKVDQLFKVAKERKISIDELKEVITITDSFMKELNKGFNDFIKEENISYNKSVEALHSAIKTVGEISKTASSDDVRLKAIETVQKITTYIYELESNRSSDHKHLYIGIIMLAGLVFSILQKCFKDDKDKEDTYWRGKWDKAA